MYRSATRTGWTPSPRGRPTGVSATGEFNRRRQRASNRRLAADLSDSARVPALVDVIRDRFGRIEAVAYGPIGGDHSFTPAGALEAATSEALFLLLPLTPVELFRAVLPEMTERGDGAALASTGYHGGAADRRAAPRRTGPCDVGRPQRPVLAQRRTGRHRPCQTLP